MNVEKGAITLIRAITSVTHVNFSHLEVII
jgi:hypothetical protein